MNDHPSAAPLGSDDVHADTIYVDKPVKSYRLRVSDGAGLVTPAALEFTLEKGATTDPTVVLAYFTDEASKQYRVEQDRTTYRLTTYLPTNSLARYQAVLHEFQTWSLQVGCNEGERGLGYLTLSGHNVP